MKKAKSLFFLLPILFLFISSSPAFSLVEWPGDCTLLVWSLAPTQRTVINGFVGHVDTVVLVAGYYPNYGTAHSHYSTVAYPAYFVWAYIESYFWNGIVWRRKNTNTLRSDPAWTYAGDQLDQIVNVPFSDWANRANYFPASCAPTCEPEWNTLVAQCHGADSIVNWQGSPDCTGECLSADNKNAGPPPTCPNN